MRVSLELEPSSLLVIIGLFGYLGFALYQFWRPGLQYDEVLFVNAALGNIDGSFVAFQVDLAGHHIPLMCMEYIGALKAWLWSGVFAAFGVSAATIRIPAIIAACAALYFVYLFTRKLIDERVAVMATLLVAFDPSYIFATRLDWGPVALMELLKISALYVLLNCWRKRDFKLALLGGVLLGLGVYDKTNFGWLIIAAPLAAAISAPRALRGRIRSLVLPVALGAVAGALPLIWFNVAHPLATFLGQLNSSGPLLAALSERIEQFKFTVGGPAVLMVVSSGQTGNYPAVIAPYDFLVPAFLIALGVIAVTCGLRREMPAAVRFCLSLCAILFVLTVVTSAATGPHHQLFLYPFPHIIIAIAISELMTLLASPKRAHMATPLAAVVMLALLGSEVITNSSYIRYFASTGGAGEWSDKIYDLADAFAASANDKYALMDWGMSNQINALDAGRVSKDEVFWKLSLPAMTNEQVDAAAASILGTDSKFVFHSAGYAAFPLVRERFDKYVHERGLTENSTVISEEDGRPLYEVISVAASPPATAAPLNPQPSASPSAAQNAVVPAQKDDVSAIDFGAEVPPGLRHKFDGVFVDPDPRTCCWTGKRAGFRLKVPPKADQVAVTVYAPPYPDGASSSPQSVELNAGTASTTKTLSPGMQTITLDIPKSAVSRSVAVALTTGFTYVPKNFGQSDPRSLGVIIRKIEVR